MVCCRLTGTGFTSTRGEYKMFCCTSKIITKIHQFLLLKMARQLLFYFLFFNNLNELTWFCQRLINVFFLAGIAENASRPIAFALKDSWRIRYHSAHLSYLLKAIQLVFQHLNLNYHVH